MNYNPKKIERRWQRAWKKLGVFRAKDFSKKPKFYILDMFPYPSGEGLHVGHPRGYTATDVVSHYKRMQGYNVLHPMGWDAFGLPAENYALKTGIHPAISTKRNIRRIKNQIKSIGFSYDWEREINTTDPEYYKWTQWIFLKLFEKGLAYEAILPINFCPSCKTGLANEEVTEGKCERCQTPVIRKDIRQWVLKITAYAERLLKDLEDLDWPERIKEMQRNWIGKSEGTEIKFSILSSQFTISVFTTRADTLFGCTYLVLAPEHPLIEKLKDRIINYKFVKEYIEKAKQKLERERLVETKEKTGIELQGIKVINPVNNREIPVFVADYVLMHYGTGAIMAVPCHDQRDFIFAKKYNLPMVEVIRPYGQGEKTPKTTPLILSDRKFEKAYEGEGYLINSGRFDGLDSKKAKEKITEWLKEKGLAKKAVHYKLRDWVFSRQRYWGEPIPIIHCPKCGKVPVPEKDLPLRLPKVKKYQPTGTGESPLATLEKWVNTKCPRCGAMAKRETNTMPQWAGSCWYYLRYIDPKNKREFSSRKKEKYWMPVDLYIGGAEHAVLHLLYARFWHKVLYDLNLVSTKEPFLKLRNQGLILAPDGQKMSKSRGNVINPDEIIEKYGADTLRLYEMFMGPFNETVAWSTQGIMGQRRFLERVWRLKSKVNQRSRITNHGLQNLLHKTIKKVTEDIENFRFNTAISALMILTNEFEKAKELPAISYQTLLKLLAPLAPHIAEELWQKLGHKKSIFFEKWPRYNPELIKEEKVTLVIQVNGKVRDKIEIEHSFSEKEAKDLALGREKVKRWIEGKEIKKVIFVPGKLINFVI